MSPSNWFAVRTILHHRAEPSAYEERITLWSAENVDAAMGLAEGEAQDYADSIESEPLSFQQAFHLFAEPGNGIEIFSLMRDSDLEPAAYVTRFFDTGREHTESTE